ncbi:hypothetical protein JK358_35750 [Nocardia sp. 2]|uniref:Uncharacterized protein n=1 Tax=Nocardia acididurans TaxID=2802282 RepID=A0ABS1MI96_9NOCA|nr:hypothetical protein [Nocardia acididurans]MBL1079770.1 hypothetical protein [Nocardia acididurans]
MTTSVTDSDATTNLLDSAGKSIIPMVARYRVQLIETPEDRSRLTTVVGPAIIKIIDKAESVFRCSLDTLGRGGASPPPPPKTNPVRVDNKQARTTVISQAVEDYTKAETFLDNRIVTMRSLDTSVANSSVLVCSNGHRTRDAIIKIVDALKAHIATLVPRTKPLTTSEKYSLMTRIMDDIDTTYQLMWDALKANLDVADGGGGGTGRQSRDGAGTGSGSGGIMDMISSLMGSLAMPLMLAAQAIPDVIEKLSEAQDDAKDDKDEDKGKQPDAAAGQPQPESAAPAPAPAPVPATSPAADAAAPIPNPPPVTPVDANAQAATTLPAVTFGPGTQGSRDRRNAQSPEPAPKTDPEDPAESPT